MTFLGNVVRSGAPAVALAAMALTQTRNAEACGGCFHPENDVGGSVVTDHRMVFEITSKETILWDQVRYAGNPAEFAWVLPVRAGARIELSRGEWIAALDAATRTTVEGPRPVCPPTTTASKGQTSSSSVVFEQQRRLEQQQRRRWLRRFVHADQRDGAGRRQRQHHRRRHVGHQPDVHRRRQRRRRRAVLDRALPGGDHPRVGHDRHHRVADDERLRGTRIDRSGDRRVHRAEARFHRATTSAQSRRAGDATGSRGDAGRRHDASVAHGRGRGGRDGGADALGDRRRSLRGAELPECSRRLEPARVERPADALEPHGARGCRARVERRSKLDHGGCRANEPHGDGLRPRAAERPRCVPVAMPVPRGARGAVRRDRASAGGRQTR